MQRTEHVHMLSIYNVCVTDRITSLMAEMPVEREARLHRLQVNQQDCPAADAWGGRSLTVLTLGK